MKMNNKWNDYYYKVEDVLITPSTIKDFVNNFKKDVTANFQMNQAYFLIMKVELNNLENENNYSVTQPVRSISRMYVLKKGGDLENRLEYLLGHWWDLRQQYHKLSVNQFIFTYCPISPEKEKELANKQNKNNNYLMEDDNLSDELESLLNDKTIYTKEQLLNYKGLNLPPTMDITKWGICYFNSDFKLAIIIPEKNIERLIEEYDPKTIENWLKLINLNQDLILDLEDSKQNSLNNAKYIFKNNLIHKNLFSIPYYYIEIEDNYMFVQTRIFNNVIFSFIDKLTLNIKNIQLYESDLNDFSRKIIGQTKYYIYKNSKRVLVLLERQTPFITSKKKDNYITDRFITMDLETRVVDTKMLPYCISINDGEQIYNYYLTDFENEESMIKTSLRRLFSKKYHTWNVYIHNFSYFDGVLLLNTISQLSSELNIIMRENSIINLQVKFEIINTKGNRVKNYVNFRDSYNLLPADLAKLAKSFNVSNKGYFPYKFINENNDLNYKGQVPFYSYFDKNKISLEEYDIYKEEFKNKSWEMRTETIKYCNQDVITLHEVIKTFSFYIYEKFNINIHRTPTISSLAFTIYRANFLNDKKVKIPVLTGDLYKDIRKSYIGGLVDVYKPKGSNILEYDVNSLYPSIMHNCMMPVGKPVYFEGDLEDVKDSNIDNSDYISKLLVNPYGFYYVEVESPLNIKVPVLPLKKIDFKTSNHTITPVGCWTGWYFSEEINNAKKYGYKFKILKGYLFDKQNIFKDYVEFLYSLKKQYSTDTKHPLYLIVKLLLNSLYGKFGMNPCLENHKIIDNDKLIDFCINNKVTNHIKLSNDLSLISFFKKEKNKSGDLFKKESFLKEGVKNVSIAIASAVTAEARNYMSKFKTIEDGAHLYYSDTDSIFTTKPLDTEYVGNELGQFKLVNNIEHGIFLAPKTYAITTLNPSPSGINRELIVKFKGLQVKKLEEPLTMEKMEKLLIKDQIYSTTQEKWERDIGKSTITVKKVDFNYKLNADAKTSKRELIYDEDLNFIDTKPIKVNYKLNNETNK